MLFPSLFFLFLLMSDEKAIISFYDFLLIYISYETGLLGEYD